MPQPRSWKERLGDSWSQANFEASGTRIEQQLAAGQLREALEGAQALLQRTQSAGGQAYANTDYDLAIAFWLLGRVLKTAGESEQALPLLIDARQRFEAVAKERTSRDAELMASSGSPNEAPVCLLWAGSTRRRRPTKRTSSAPSNSKIPGRSPWAKASLGPFD